MGTLHAKNTLHWGQSRAPVSSLPGTGWGSSPDVLSLRVLAMGALPWNLGWGCWAVPVPAMPSMLCLSAENGPKQRRCGDNRGVPGVLPEGKATGLSAALLGLCSGSHFHAIILCGWGTAHPSMALVSPRAPVLCTKAAGQDPGGDIRFGGAAQRAALCPNTPPPCRMRTSCGPCSSSTT